MSEFALPCIKCGKPLKNVDADTSENQPSGGTEFITHGHYGSTIFDSMDRTDYVLVVNICDTCIMRAIDAGVIQGRTTIRTIPKIHLSRHPLSEESRAWVLAQNEKYYGSAYGEDVPVDYREQMIKAGWPEDQLGEE